MKASIVMLTFPYATRLYCLQNMNFFRSVLGTVRVSNEGILNLTLQNLKEKWNLKFIFFTTFNAINPVNSNYVAVYIKLAAFRAEVYQGHLNAAKIC